MPALLQSLQSRTAFRLHSIRVTLLTILFCAASSLWASVPVTKFNGVVATLNTGTVTLSGPAGVVVDPAGDVYIVDVSTNTVIEVSVGGTASTLDLSAVGALNGPTALARDPAGTLYIADTGNNRIIKYDTTGNASVVNLGSLTLSNPQALAVDSAGTLYIADSNNARIIKLPAGGTAAVFSLTGLSTPIGNPVGLCTDVLGNLYIGDVGHYRVVKATAAGAASVVTVGSSLPSDFAPYGLAVDTLGNLYIADINDGGLVATVTPAGVTTLQNFGSTTIYPYGIAVDAAGTLYVADLLHQRVVTQAASTINFGHVQLGATTGTTITLPFTIASADTLATVQALTVGAANLDFTVVAGGTTCATGATHINCNVNVQFLPTAPGLRRGAVVLTLDNLTLTVPVFGTSDAPMATLNPGTASLMNVGSTPLSYPFQTALDGAGNLYVANYYGSGANVVKYPPGGGTGTAVSTGSITLYGPSGVAVDGAGNLYIASYSNGAIVRVPVSGSPSTLTITGLATPVSLPTSLAIDASGNLYIADYRNARIVKVTPSGAGSVLSTGSFTLSGYTVTSVAVDPFGTVYFNDIDNARVVKVTAAGVASLVAFPGITPAISGPVGMTVDGMGNFYLNDAAATSRIIEVTTAGVVSVLQVPGLTSPATLGLAYNLMVDPLGNLVFPDYQQNRIVNLNLAAGNLAYLNTAVGATSTDSPKIATVTNIGNLSLLFAADPVYPTDFVVNSGNTSLCAAATPLTAGMACDVAAKFIPLSPGALSETVALTDNALNVTGSAQQVNVAGTGVRVDTTVAAVTATPATVSIGQPIVIAVSVTDSTAPGTIPTGYVTLSDLVGTTATSLTTGQGIALSGGAATMSNVVLSGGGTHTITANYTGVSNSFHTSTTTTTVTVNLDTTAVALTATPVTLTVGQPLALAASVTDATAPGTVPTGYVTFTDTVGGTTTSLTTGPGIALNGNGAAAISNVILSGGGTHTITANYTGVSGSLLASTRATTVTVNLITPTVTGPAVQPVQVVHGQAGSIPVSYAGVNGLPGPDGTVTYTIVNAANGTVASGTFRLSGEVSPATVTIPIASTLASGLYTVNVIYSGSAYYAAPPLAIQLQIGQSTPVVTFAAPAPIPYGTALGSGRLTATAAYNGTSVPGSFTFTATPAGGTVTAASILPAGTYTLTATFTPTDTTTYTTATAQAALTVTKVASLATLTASVSTLNPGQSVTLTSVVTSTTTGTPTGTVSFYDGTIRLGTATLTSGQAVFIATGLLSGVHSLTAVYGGDANFTGVTGGGTGLAVTVAPLDFTLTSTQTGTPSVLPGAVVNYSLSITPTYGSFPGAVTFAVTGLPAGATWTMNPATLPASSTGSALALTVQTVAPTATASLRAHTGQLLWALLVLPLAGARRLRRLRRMHSRLRGAGLLMLLLLGSAAVLGLSGCGATIGIFGQSPQTYNLTVTATSGAIQHAVNLSLNIQ